MVEALKTGLPNYKFVLLPDKKSIVQQAKFWRTARFAMMIHGSGQKPLYLNLQEEIAGIHMSCSVMF